jgi:hypothetical protein
MILISCSDENRAQADTVVKFLHENIEIPTDGIMHTFHVWNDSADAGDVSRKLKTYMGKARTVIAIISPESSGKRELLFELGAAWALNLFILILFLPGVDARDIPEPLADCVYVNVDAKDAHIRLRDATREIASFLRLPEKKGMHIFSSLDAALKLMRHPQEDLGAADDDDLELPGLGPVPGGAFTPMRDEFYDITYTVNGRTTTEELRIRASWDSIFKAIAPHLREPQDEAFIKKLILELCKEKDPDLRRGIEYKLFLNPMLNVDCYAQIINQFSSQSLIKNSRPPHSIFKTRNDLKYWIITPEGEDHLRSSIERMRSLKK